MTSAERFGDKLAELLEFESKAAILAVPGVWELLAEEYNDIVIDALEAEEEDAYE
jgi:hypothetical protein